MKQKSTFKPRIGPTKRLSSGQKAAKFLRTQKATAKRIQGKAIVREAKHQANLKRGGPAGALARALEHKRVKAEAKNTLESMKPKIYAEERRTLLKTDAEVKRTKAKGAAAAAVASALGASYSAGKDADARREAYKTAGIEAQTKALKASLESVPSISDEGKSVAGLVTGVR